MKNTSKAVLALVALGASAWLITAQDAGNQAPGNDNQGRPPRRFQGPPPGEQMQEGQDGPGMHRRRPPVPPLLAALDANHDGVIDAAEIANASAALLTLDKNGDGQLTMDELMPPRPPGGPDGFGPGHPPRGPRHGDDQQTPEPGK